MENFASLLRQVAHEVGVDLWYRGWQGIAVEASDTTLLSIVTALGPQACYALSLQPTVAELQAALRTIVRRRMTSGVQPVLVSWDGAVVDVTFAVRADVDGDWALSVTTEQGHVMPLQGRLFDLSPSDHRDVDGVSHCFRHVTFAIGALGYHAMTWATVVDGETTTGESMIISAPVKSYVADDVAERSWGVFAPLYNLKSPWSGGMGDLGTLRHFAHLVEEWGGSYIATLPLLAGFFSEPCQISPYSPASRMFWNELYLDLFDAAKRVRVIANIESDGYLERARLFAYHGLDYKAQYAWKRVELDRLAAVAFLLDDTRVELQTWCESNPDAVDYAAFRALGEKFQASWSQWPAEWRDHRGFFSRLDDVPLQIDRDAVQSHIFAQWMLEQQLGKVGWGLDVGLYLDLPVGVNRDAYEVWRRRELFVLGASAGAPPDELFLGGQDWGLPPLHPQAVRRDHYRYVIACVREHMRHASMLRIDHVMGLFRLYCVPAGQPATQGVYIRYHSDEMLAILCLESHRNKCVVVGENLGTVPDCVPPAMERHGFLGLHVAQFDLDATPPAATVASLNTHDTATFAGWWQGRDIDDRHQLGLIDDDRHRRDHRDRRAQCEALVVAAGVDVASIGRQLEYSACELVMRYVTDKLAASQAAVVLITLEDLWLEPLPQNVPGTSTERPNWQRPMTRNFQDFGGASPMLGFGADSVFTTVDLTPVVQLWAHRLRLKGGVP
jgi:4-alpha-glucanotransferase